MDKTIIKSKISGNISVPISKSFAHRILICAALSDKPTKIYGKSEAIDIKTTAECLISMGADIKETDYGYEVIPITNSTSTAILNCRESGSTLRFLLPVAAALGKNAEFYGEGKLPVRPVKQLLDSLNKNGANINYTMPYKLSGRLISGEYLIDGNISSQYISGLLMALPLLNKNSKIIIKNKLSSIDYIKITLSVLKNFGIMIEKTDYGFFIYGGQKYLSPSCMSIESDWSSASVWAIAAAISGTVTLKNMTYPSYQGDSKIIDILKNCGADVAINEDSITITKNVLNAFTVDCENIIDITPYLSILAANAFGESQLYNLERLRIKESDRLNAIIEMLNGIGIYNSYDTKTSTLHIKGGKINGGQSVRGYADHRIAMAGVLSGINAENPVCVTDCESVKKSYAEFFEDFISLGGKIEKC